jgi:signal transduction histidine kinase
MGLRGVGDGFDGDGQEWESLCGVLEAGMKSLELAQGLRKCLEGGSCLERGGGAEEVVRAASFAGLGGGIHENPLPVLLDLSERILELARELAGSATEFGPDGPEMFRFVEKSSEQMHQRLVKIASSEPEQQGNQLRDREVRHEFRNILASVRGFTDLILMEQGIPEDLVSGLKGICGCSNQFVEWLDAEKAAALGQ